MEQIFTIVGTTLIIHLPSELDHHSSEQLKGEADHLIEHHNIRQVLFDFQRTVFMDSSGIGMMIGRYKLMRCLGGNVAAIRVGESMQRILAMAGLYKLIDIHEGLPQEYHLI